MNAIYIAICALFILLGFEIRHRQLSEELLKLRSKINRLDEEIIRLKEEMKFKQDVYKEYNPPKL